MKKGKNFKTEFSSSQKKFFGAKIGAVSEVTDRESKDGQVTLTKFEEKVVFSMTPALSIPLEALRFTHICANT